jgi:hypothetical protein
MTFLLRLKLGFSPGNARMVFGYISSSKSYVNLASDLETNLYFS